MSAAAGTRDGALLCGTVLLAAVAEFGQVWYYPATEAGGEVTRALGGGFRLALWLAASAAILRHLSRIGPHALVRVLAPFTPFLAWSAVAVPLWSVDPVAGLRVLAFWLLAAGAAVAAAAALTPRALARGVVLGLVAVVAGSLVVALVDPLSATTAYGDAAMVRGLFPHKNAFGWFCALGLIWTVGVRRLAGLPLAAVATAALAVGLAASGSRTAMATLPVVAAHAAAISGCRRLFRDGGRGALGLLVAVAVLALAAAAAWPALIEGLGRDATLTGRTDVWRHYLAVLNDRPLGGYGPGILSSDTEINRAIGAGVPGYETAGLRSPHSLYVGLACEVGLVGLGAFLAAMLWLALAGPFRRPGPWPVLAGGLAVAILFAGVTEMRDGAMPGAATLLMIAARTMGLRGQPAAEGRSARAYSATWWPRWAARRPASFAASSHQPARRASGSRPSSG